MSILEILSQFQTTFPELPWSLTPMDKQGILSTNTFKQAKAFKENPAVIASDISEQISSQFPEYAVEAVGPYINIDLSPEQWDQAKTWDGKPNLAKIDQKAMVEYCGANVAKNLHVGHMRNINIGEALFRMLKMKYRTVISDNHWGDWGVNMGVLIWGWKHSGDKTAYAQDPMKELTRVYVWSNAQKENNPDWEQETRLEFKKLEDKDPVNYTLWKDFIEVTKEHIKTDLDTFNITPFDLEQGESFYEDDMNKLTEFLDQHDLWHKEGKARYFEYEELAADFEQLDEQTRASIKNFGRGYLISSLGYSTYLYRDIATRWQWARDHNIDLAITLADFRQKHNFDQTFAAIAWISKHPKFALIEKHHESKQLRYANFKHVGYGVTLIKGVKMSSRTGTVLLMSDLYKHLIETIESSAKKRGDIIDTVKSQNMAVAALKWNDLNKDTQEDVSIDTEEIIQFEGNTGVYQLYTYARLNSIIQKNSQPDDFSWNTLRDNEQQIIKRILYMEYDLERAILQLKPSLITQSLYALASDLNSWYNTTNVTRETDKKRKDSLLYLITLSLEVFNTYLALLGINVVEDL